VKGHGQANRSRIKYVGWSRRRLLVRGGWRPATVRRHGRCRSTRGCTRCWRQHSSVPSRARRACFRCSVVAAPG